MLWHKINFSAARFDTGLWNIATPTRLTASAAGKYIFVANVAAWNAAVGNYTITIAFQLNGTTTFGVESINSSINNYFTMSTSAIYSLAANDYVEVMVSSNYAGTVNVLSLPDYAPDFSMVALNGAQGPTGPTGANGSTAVAIRLPCLSIALSNGCPSRTRETGVHSPTTS